MSTAWKRAVWAAFSSAIMSTAGILFAGWAAVPVEVKLTTLGQWLALGGIAWYGTPPEGMKP